MADRLNPAGKTAAESDYQKKFDRTKKQPSVADSKDADDLKRKEAATDANWKTATKKTGDAAKKGRFSFSGRKGGSLRKGSAFLFLFGLLAGGIWYTSVFAPNILLVNIKEMYTNDLADSTAALQIYTQIAYFNKIGPMSGQECIDGQPMNAQPIKCKLTTMSRSEKEAFERQGFLFGFGDINLGVTNVNGDVAVKKVYEDNRDDGDPSNDLPESRYKVYAILPPSYSRIVNSLKTEGTSALTRIANGGDIAKELPEGVENAVSQALGQLQGTTQSPQQMLEGILNMAPITSGPQLWLYAQLSSTTRAQVYGVFHPKASFFSDAKFKERIKTRYNMTKGLTVTGTTEQKVNQSFDRSVQKADGGIDALTGQANPTDGVSLASLSGPLNLTQLQSLANTFQGGINQQTINSTVDRLPFAVDLQGVGNLLATNTYSYTDLMCSWYTIGKISSNALTRAKATTAARYALQYLKAADSIKAGTAQEVPTNVLASRLASGTLGGYEGGSATDSLIYKFITYGDFMPGTLGEFGSMVAAAGQTATSITSDALAIVMYNLSAYENIGTLAASWAQVIPNAAALGAVTGASGALLPPPANMSSLGLDRQYCMSGETLTNKTTTKGETTQTTRCMAAIEAMAPLGMQAAMAGAVEVGRRTCPPTNASDDNLIQLYLGNWRGPVHNTVLPSQKIVQASMTPYVAGWFGANSMIAATATQQLYTSQTKGIAANYALFSGMGELLGDMAMSRGLMPSNIADMQAYLYLGEILGAQQGSDDVLRHEAKQNQFDPYNKFSFVGSLVRSLPANTLDANKAPIFGTLASTMSLITNSLATLTKTPAADAFYQTQPMLLTRENAGERLAGYLARLSSAFCPVDLEYLQIGITPDIMCNVRYSMPLEDIPMALNLNGIIDYMTKSDSKVYDSKSQELDQRVSKADTIGGEQEYLILQQQQLNQVKNQPFIDKNTGKPTKGGEYEKYLQYCVNRLDPWGRSGVYMRYDGLTDEEKAARDGVLDQNGNATSPDNPGDPNQKFRDGIPTMAVTATQSDLDWYTGKKCTRMTDQMQMLQYFRIYTALCSVDGSMAGIIDCTEPDKAGNYSDPFYLNNDILYTSWY